VVEEHAVGVQHGKASCDVIARSSRPQNDLNPFSFHSLKSFHSVRTKVNGSLSGIHERFIQVENDGQAAGLRQGKPTGVFNNLIGHGAPVVLTKITGYTRTMMVRHLSIGLLPSVGTTAQHKLTKERIPHFTHSATALLSGSRFSRVNLSP